MNLFLKKQKRAKGSQKEQKETNKINRDKFKGNQK